MAAEYQRLIDGIENAYLSHRDWWYCQENRWPNEPFWACRHSKVAAHTRSVRTRTEPNIHPQRLHVQGFKLKLTGQQNVPRVEHYVSIKVPHGFWVR